MKRRITYLICLALSACLFTGCGGASGKKEGVSGGAVSGGAVSGQAVENIGENRAEAAAKPEDYRYCSDTCFYCGPGIVDLTEDFDDDTYDVVQIPFDSGKAKGLSLWDEADYYYSEVLYADRDGLYMYREDFGDYEDRADLKVYRIPLVKDGDGNETPDTSAQEEIISVLASVEGDVYMDGEVICYFDGKTEELWEYDRESGKKKSHGKPPMTERYGLMYSQLMRSGEHILAYIAGKGMYYLDGTGDKWNEVPSEEGSNSFYAEWEGDQFYYAREDKDQLGSYGIKCKDMSTGRTESFVKKEELKAALTEILGISEKELVQWGVISLLGHEGRLYIQIHARWERDGVYQIRNVNISRSMGEDPTLVYEKGLTESIAAHEQILSGAWKNKAPKGVKAERVQIRCGACAQVQGGKAYLCLGGDDDDNGLYGIYDMRTGEFHEIAMGDKEYYEPFYEDLDFQDWRHWGGKWYLPDGVKVKWD